MDNRKRNSKSLYPDAETDPPPPPDPVSYKFVIWCLRGHRNIVDEIVNFYYNNDPDNIHTFDVFDFDTREELLSQLNYADRYSALPDFIVICNRDFDNLIKTFPDKFVRFDEAIDPEEFMGSVLEQVTDKNGQICAIPFSCDVAAMYYRRDIAQDAFGSADDFGQISSWEEYIEAVNNSDIIKESASHVLMYTPQFTETLMRTTGRLFYNNGIYEPYGAQEYLEILERLRTEGMIDTDTELTYDEMIQLLTDGQVFSFVGPSWWFPVINRIVEENGLEQEWGVTDIFPLMSDSGFPVGLDGLSFMVFENEDQNKNSAAVDLLVSLLQDNIDLSRILVSNYDKVVPVTYKVYHDLIYADEESSSEGYGAFNENVKLFLTSKVNDIPYIETGEYSYALLGELNNISLDIIGGSSSGSGYGYFLVYYDDNIPTLVPVKIPTAIEFDSPPSKTDYYKYENINKAGLSVVAYYEDGTDSTIYDTDLTVDPDFLNISGQPNISVTYSVGGSSFTLANAFSVNVENRTLTGLDVSTRKRYFTPGDALGKNDFTVYAKYDKGDRRRVENFIFYPEKLSDEIGSQQITVTYSEDEKSIVRRISIEKEKRLEKIEIVKYPDKFFYVQGDWLDVRGMQVKATYSDGTEEIVPNGRLETDECIRFASGSNSAQVKITYYSKNGIKDAFVKVYRKTGAEVDDCNIDQDMGGSGSGSINLRSGILRYKFVDFTGGDSVVPITVSHIYKDSVGYDRGVGAHWRLNIQQELSYYDGHWVYSDKSGKEHVFDDGYPTDRNVASDDLPAENAPAVTRSSIRNEQLGMDLFVDGGNGARLIDRSNNTLVFKRINNVYRLTGMHVYPSTPDAPIDAFSMAIAYDETSGNVSSVKAGKTIGDNRPTLEFGYSENGLLETLTFKFRKDTQVAKYVYDDNGRLTSVTLSDNNVANAQTRTTEFAYSDGEYEGYSYFTVTDYTSADGNNNFKTLKYEINAAGKVSGYSVGYGNDRDTATLRYSERSGQTSEAPEDITAVTFVEYKDVLSVTRFNKDCAVAQYGYRKPSGANDYRKIAQITGASSYGFGYKSLADTYADTLDIFADDFDSGTCDWEGGTTTAEYTVCGAKSLRGNNLRKKYVVSDNKVDERTLYLSLWLKSDEATVSADIMYKGTVVKRKYNNYFDAGDEWQFVSICLGKVKRNSEIVVKINGITSACINTVRITRLPYETPENIGQPKYDAFGNVIESYRYLPIKNKIARTENKYNVRHQIASSTVTIDGEVYEETDYTYDARNLPVSTLVKGKTQSIYCQETSIYNEKYELTKTGDINGVETEYEYGSDESTTYFEQQTVVGEESVVPITTKSTYYIDSSVLKELSSEDCRSSYTYAANGALARADIGYNSNNYTSHISFDYDTFGNLSSVSVDGDTLVSFAYDSRHLQKVSYANGAEINYAYDNYDRPIGMSGSGLCSPVTIAYSESGDTVTVSDGNVVYTSVTKNKRGVLGEYSVSLGSNKLTVKTLAVNNTGNVSTTEYYIGNTMQERVKTTADDFGKTTEINRNIDNIGEVKASYAYDELHRLSSKSVKFPAVSPFTTDYEYDAMQSPRQTMRVRTEEMKIGGMNCDKYIYRYNKTGNIDQVVFNDGSGGKTLFIYHYDEHNRLKEEYDYTAGKSYYYLYDNDGNIAGKKIFELDSTGTHTQHPSETISYSYTPSNNVATGNGAKRALLYKYGEEAIEYDAYGNPISYFGRTMTWTGRLLTKVTIPNSEMNEQTEMTYDCNGLRIKKGNITYYWCDGKLVTERRTENGATKTQYYLYDESGVCGMISNGVPYYFRKNITGDVVAIYTATGSLVCRYVYSAWGEQRIYDGNGNTLEDDGVGVWSINPFRYRGYYWDREFGLYYLQSRYYDPAVGRFISPDDIEYLDPTTVGGLNLYAYCGNNPVMYSDGSGQFPILISVLIGLGIGLASEFFGDLIDDGKINRDWKDYLGAGVAGLIGGFSTGLISTMVLSGVGDVVGGLINGSITDIGQAAGAFVLSAAFAGIGYGIAKGIQHGAAKIKYGKIIGASTSNIKINNKLAQAGLKGVKIGRDGLNAVLEAVKKRYFPYLDDGINAMYDFICGLFGSLYLF